jgi:hypothetical protein
VFNGTPWLVPTVTLVRTDFENARRLFIGCSSPCGSAVMYAASPSKFAAILTAGQIQCAAFYALFRTGKIRARWL